MKRTGAGGSFPTISADKDVRFMWRRIMIYIGFALTLYVAVIAFMYFGQRKLMYHPSSQLGPPASYNIAEVVPIKLPSTDGLTIVSWFRAAGTNKPIIVYFHGNAGHVGDRGGKVRAFVDAGYGLLLVGYRGFGGNPGQPTEQGLYDDAAAALNFLVRTGVSSDHWVLYGESLGSAVAVEMARRFADKPVAAVVLEAPFTSMADAAKSHYPFVPAGLLLKDKYDSFAKIGRINSPVLVVHGDQDKTVPIGLGQRLFEAAAEPKIAQWIKGAGHGDLYDFGVDGLIISYLKKIWSQKCQKFKAIMDC